jgi:hypothetical protein
MNATHTLRAGAIGLTLFLIASVASAQTSGVSVTTIPGTGTVTAGSGVNLGTITIMGPSTGASVTAIPLTFTASGGASVSNLSNCQIYNSLGQSISGTVNPATNGAASFSLSAAQNVNTTASTYSVRCDVASGTPSGATFSYSAGVPTLMTALSVNIDVAPSVPAGSQDVALANIFLDASNSGSTVNLASLPITVSAGNGASVAHLSDCRVRNAANLSGSLTSVVPSMTNGVATSYSFTTPLSIMAAGTQSFSYTCDVSAATPVGGTFTVSINPSSVAASNASTGATVIPTALVGTGPNGLPASTQGTVIVSAFGSGVGEGPTGDTGTPGAPNTGAGGLAVQLALILALSATVAGGGAMYLRYRLLN